VETSAVIRPQSRIDPAETGVNTTRQSRINPASRGPTTGGRNGCVIAVLETMMWEKAALVFLSQSGLIDGIPSREVRKLTFEAEPFHGEAIIS